MTMPHAVLKNPVRAIEEPFGPSYPKFTVPKAVKAKGSAAHGEYVLRKIAALQLASLEAFCTRGKSINHCPCTSGCWESDGYAILKAVLSQNSKAMGYVYANG